jgi:hypothetical protein
MQTQKRGGHTLHSLAGDSLGLSLPPIPRDFPGASTLRRSRFLSPALDTGPPLLLYLRRDCRRSSRSVFVLVTRQRAYRHGSVFGTPPCLRSRRCQHPGSTFYHLRSVFLKHFFTSNLYPVGVANGIDAVFLVSLGSTRFACNPSGFLRRLHCCYHPLGADMSSYMVLQSFRCKYNSRWLI